MYLFSSPSPTLIFVQPPPALDVHSSHPFIIHLGRLKKIHDQNKSILFKLSLFLH